MNFSRYLVSKGAIIDKIGGDLKSTPLHWATRYIEVEFLSKRHLLITYHSEGKVKR